MRDSDYILDKITLSINDTLSDVNNRLIKGHVKSMEEYKYNLGMRCVLCNLQSTINELSKGYK